MDSEQPQKEVYEAMVKILKEAGYMLATDAIHTSNYFVPKSTATIEYELWVTANRENNKPHILMELHLDNEDRHIVYARAYRDIATSHITDYNWQDYLQALKEAVKDSEPVG